MRENFEGAFPGTGWLVGDNDGAANGEYYWAKSDCLVREGDYAGWAVGGGSDGSQLYCGADYPDSTLSYMIYGPFSLAGVNRAEFALRVWLNAEERYDYLRVMASLDGINFSYDPDVYTGTWGEWREIILDLGNVPGLGNLKGQPRVWVGLLFETDTSVSMADGAIVDELIVRKCTSCASAPSTTQSAGRVGTFRLR